MRKTDFQFQKNDNKKTRFFGKKCASLKKVYISLKKLKMMTSTSTWL
jgi:hypothetical protein